MHKPGVLVVTADRQDGQHFCGLLGAMHYSSRQLPSLEDLQVSLREESNVAVILDLDTIPADNQFFRTLRKTHPQLHILGVSSLAYHPGREDVIGSLYACLVRPLDVDELEFWLKTITENMAEIEHSTGREVSS